MKSWTKRWTQTRRLNRFWINFKIIKNSKVTYKDSVIHKFTHYKHNVKYKFLYTSFIAQNTSFNLTKNKNKTLHFFTLIILFNNDQTEFMRDHNQKFVTLFEFWNFVFFTNASIYYIISFRWKLRISRNSR